ncbi:hypothetical protein JOC77_003573 [Peribacillus deserti]|uniref:Uncharacterized protein n=1 Tax=Peribacillus deserti TaxID=673318 RepID=A0ABS2QN32_9BACI|nr:hypothetical protein [Peribacillus deserti]MBM7694129.1 hypothetical protein [Peribacillus deserti]
MSANYEKITLSDINEMLEKLDLLLDGVKPDYPQTYEENVSNY